MIRIKCLVCYVYTDKQKQIDIVSPRAYNKENLLRIMNKEDR